MCAFGEPIGADEAYAVGIVDRDRQGRSDCKAPSHLRESVMADPPRKTRDREEKLRDADPAIFERARAAGQENASRPDCTARRHRRRRGRDQALVRRRLRARGRTIQASACSPTQSKALIHAFFAERAVAKIPDIPKDDAGLSRFAARP